ncbi:MAG: hypothetical protein WKG07_50005 [Hymenobacter sp.]
MAADPERNYQEWGYYRKKLANAAAPQRVVMAPFSYSPLMQARHAPVFLYTKANVSHSADLYLSRDLTHETQLSHLNPQQASYNWLTAELVRWTTPKGYAATGVCTSPRTSTPPKSIRWWFISTKSCRTASISTTRPRLPPRGSTSPCLPAMGTWCSRPTSATPSASRGRRPWST